MSVGALTWTGSEPIWTKDIHTHCNRMGGSYICQIHEWKGKFPHVLVIKSNVRRKFPRLHTLHGMLIWMNPNVNKLLFYLWKYNLGVNQFWKMFRVAATYSGQYIFGIVRNRYGKEPFQNICLGTKRRKKS